MKLSTYKRGLIIRFRNNFKKKEQETGEHIKILSHYKTERTPMKFKCLDCGLVFTKKPINVLHNKLICPKRSKEHHVKATRKANLYRYFINIYTIRKWVKKLVGNKYKVLSKKYTDNSTKMLWEHCDKNCIYYQKYHKFYKFHMTWHGFQSGHRCPIDGLRKEHNELRKSTSFFKHEVYQQTNGEYIVKSKYKNDDTPLLMEHHSKKCQYYKKHHKYYIYKVMPHDFNRGRRCPIDRGRRISKSQSKSQAQFEKEVYQKSHGKYKVGSKYINAKRKVLLIYLDKNNSYYKLTHHFYKWWVTPNDFLYDNARCKYETMTHGEHAVEKWLLKHHLKLNKDFFYSYVCKHNPFTVKSPHLDFYLPHICYDKKHYNGIGIEFDGLQHFSIVRHSNNTPFIKLFFELCLNNYKDTLKDDYCTKYHIKMIRVKNREDFQRGKLQHLVNYTLNHELLPYLK